MALDAFDLQFLLLRRHDIEHGKSQWYGKLFDTFNLPLVCLSIRASKNKLARWHCEIWSYRRC
jgi:hypothetical protein